MAYIESHQELERHPKTLTLMGSMEWDVDTAIGKLHRFWWWCLNFAPTGDLRGKNDSVLAGSVGLAQKDAKRFVDNMVAAGWLDRDNGIFRVHDWIDYAGTYLRTSKFKRRPDLWASTQKLYERSIAAHELCPVTVTGLSGLTTHPPTHPPCGVEGGKKPGHVVSDVRSELRLAGVKSNRKVAECVAVHGVSPVAVALLAEEIRKRKGVEEAGAVIVTRLLNGFSPPALIEPEAVHGLAKAGRVLSVCGHVVQGNPVRYGKGALHVGDVSIPASELKPESIQLARGDT